MASPALRAVGNIVTGDDIQTQVLHYHCLSQVKGHNHMNAATKQISVHFCAGGVELLSVALSASPAQQRKRVYSQGSVLDHLEHNSRKQSSDTGEGYTEKKIPTDFTLSIEYQVSLLV